MKRILTYLMLGATLCACSLSKTDWVNFEDFSNLDPNTCFIPFSNGVSETDLNTLKDCKLPDGSTVEEQEAEEKSGDGKTISTNGTALFKGVISSFHSERIRSYSGSYWSVGVDGKPLRLSGRIVVPKNGKISRIMIVNHFTIGSDSEAPSNEVPIEAIFAARGIAVVEPDYIGYGITRNMIHPYLCSDITAKNVVDMYKPALNFLTHIGRKPEHSDIFILGYSQGGAVSMSVAQYMEDHCEEISIRLVMTGGGPHDICVTYDTLIDNDNTDYPCAIPMIIQGMNYGMGLNLDYDKFFQSGMKEKMFGADGVCSPLSPAWINSKNYTMAEITRLIGSHKVSAVMSAEAMDKSRDIMTDLYKAMVDNSVTSGPAISCPVYVFHSMDDNVVPFANSSNLEAWMYKYGCNAMYNFGHYGNHVKGCMRFLYSSMTLLASRGDI